MMARIAHDSGENERSELINNFLRSKARSAYNIDLLEQKYRRIEEQGLQTGVEIDFVNDVVYVPKRALRKLKKCERKEFGLSKISAPCNSLEVFGKGYAKRAKECRQLDHDFNAKFRMKFPGWQPYEPRKRPLVKRTIRETVKELVFDDPLDYLHYLMKIKGLPSQIFERKGILPLPMVAGDCSKSRECSPVRNSLTAARASALPNLMVTRSENCSRSRECSPVRNSVAFDDARTLSNLMITNKDCSRSRECSPDRSVGAVTEPSHIRKVSLCNLDHASEEDSCYSADSSKDPVERNSSTRITKSGTAPVTSPHVIEKTAKVAVSIRKEVPRSTKVSPINSDSGCASASLVGVSNTLPRQEDTIPATCKAPITVSKSPSSLMPSASTQVEHLSSTPRAPVITGRCRQKRSARNTETKASKLGATPEVTPTTSKTLSSVSRRENKQTTAKRKKVATPTSRGNITRKKSDPLPALAPAPNTDRTPATPVAVGRRQQKQLAQKTDSKAPKLRAQLEVTPAISKTVPRDASRRSSNTAKRRKATSTPVVNSLSACTPTIDGEASKVRLDSAEDASPSLPIGMNGRTRSCSAAAPRSQLTGKKVQQLRGRILRNARDGSISPTSNNSLSKNCSSPDSSDIAIRKSSLRPRAKVVKAQPSPATTPAVKSHLIPNTSIKVTRSVTRCAKDLKRRRSLKMRATPATPCGIKSSLEKSIKSSLEKSKKRCRRRKTPSKSAALQPSPLPGTMPTSSNSPMEQEDARDKNCSSTMATTSSTTRKRKSDGSDPIDTSSLPNEAPNGLWDESVQTILKSYEESVPARSGKMTILGFDAQEFRKHCGDASQTTLSSFVNFARECQDFCGENYLDNGLKEDRRAMAAAKSRNRVLKDGYFA